MKRFLSTLPGNVIISFKGRLILWHVTAVVLTFILVTSGFDGFYFASTRNPVLRDWMFPSAPIGGLVPIALPLALLAVGGLCRRTEIELAGWAVGQAALIGSLISSAYKAMTGRVHPPFGISPDVSHVFRFGFLRGGVFWGWPSSHATIAFAMSVTISRLFPRYKWLGCLAVIYAFYIGIGVSMTIHWFTDFLAGAIIGTVIGFVVAKSFLRSQT